VRPAAVELLQYVPDGLAPPLPLERGHSQLVHHLIVVLDELLSEEEDLGGEVILLAVDVDEGEALLRGVVDFWDVAEGVCVWRGVLSW
jgi:hypothetical protein